jgi:hypothetical protein
MTIFYDYVLDELRLKDVPDGSGGFWGSFYDTTTQTAASTTTEYPVTINTTYGGNGVSIGSPTSRIVFSNIGVYSITFSIQLDNTGNQEGHATIWLKLNGNNLADSASVTTVPKSHGGNNGAIITTINYVLDIQNVNDYIEVFWQSDDTNIRLVTEAAKTTPTRPLSPSIIFTAVQGGIIQGGSTTNSLASLTDVSFTSLASGNTIIANASGTFTNQSFASLVAPLIPPSSNALASLTDVSFTSLASGNTIIANASGTFFNQSFASLVAPLISPSSNALASLTDVALVSLATGMYLKYNGVKWTNDDVFINIDGGFANSNYLITQVINGGNA